MRIPNFIILLIFFAGLNPTNGFTQTIEKCFKASWASTTWTFFFYKNGEFQRISNGHYNNDTVKGNYHLIQDTIEILNGYKNTDGTVNRQYLIDKDSNIIDLTLSYQYYSFDPSKASVTYPSRKVAVNFPDAYTNDSLTKLRICDLVCNLSLQERIKKYVDTPTQKLIFQNYRYLNDKTFSHFNNCQSVIFLPENRLQKRRYIRFESFTIDDESIWIQVRVFGLTKEQIKSNYNSDYKSTFIECSNKNGQWTFYFLGDDF